MKSSLDRTRDGAASPISRFTSFDPASLSSTILVGRLNIFLILTDDLGHGDLGCYGQKQIRT